ncbi:MAG: hypothetical protein R3D02_11555 [Hyphomicrobiales bacterium]
MSVYLMGGGGNDTIDGGTGADTAWFTGNWSDYAVTYDGGTDTYTVTDRRAGSPDGVDVIRNVEFFHFADGTVALPTSSTTRRPTSVSARPPSTRTLRTALLSPMSR